MNPQSKGNQEITILKYILIDIKSIQSQDKKVTILQEESIADP